jgi:hypothetical protein
MEQHGDCANIFINFQSDRDNQWSIEVRCITLSVLMQIILKLLKIFIKYRETKNNVNFTEFISKTVAAKDKLNAQAFSV